MRDSAVGSSPSSRRSNSSSWGWLLIQGLSEAFDSPLEHFANGADIDAQDFGDFAVAEAVGAEM